jgi:hypothetical protein
LADGFISPCPSAGLLSGFMRRACAGVTHKTALAQKISAHVKLIFITFFRFFGINQNLP